VGLGGDVGKERVNRPRPKTGYIVALKYESSEAGELLSVLPGSEQPARDDKLKPQRPLEFISAIKFSSDGQSLAVGSHDNNIYVSSVRTLHDVHCIIMYAHQCIRTHALD
jgi:WD40 repeat protein